MEITINIVSVMKWYGIGCIVSAILMMFSKEYYRKTCIFFYSWIFVIYELRNILLRFLKKRGFIYLYCIISSLGQSYSMVLREYCMIKFVEKHKSNGYRKKFYNTHGNGYYRDIYGNSWDCYYDMVEFRFVEKYK